MARADEVRFWQAATRVTPALVGAYLEAGRPLPHVHEEWQFAVPEIPTKLSLGAFRRLTVLETDVTVVAPYDVHTEGGGIEAAPRWRALYVATAVVTRLYGELTGNSMGAVPRFRGSVLTDPAAARELRHLLRGGEQRGAAVAELEGTVLHWLEQLLRRHACAAGGPGHAAAVERARAYLQERATRTVSLPEVGAAAGVTTSHLVRAFSRAVGLPPRSYHAQVRLARAQRLLAEGKPATWVAYECGFTDQSHLSRRFKQSHGLTPGDFQAQIRGTSDAA
jgi:AraC-like DNA-binding protein